MALSEAQAGLLALLEVTSDGVDRRAAPGLRGAQVVTHGAFRKAIRGFYTAFPNAMVEQDMGMVFRKVAAACVDAFLAGINEEDADLRNQLAQGLESSVLETLGKAIVDEPIH
jgi:hypothetical protein